MSPKRRAGGRIRNQSPVIARLNRKQPSTRLARDGWLRADPARMSDQDSALAFRLLVSAGFALALLVGIFTSDSVIQRVQGSVASEAPVLVQSVAVLGNQRLPAAAVALASGVARDAIASQLHPERIGSTLEEHPLIRSATATLLPDGKLVVRIEERDPVALLRGSAKRGDTAVWRLVDSTGTPFAQARAEQWSRLPRLRSNRVLETGEADATLLEAIEVATLLGLDVEPSGSPREIELPQTDVGGGWVLHSQTLPRRVLLGTGELEPRLERLAMLLDADPDAARGIEEIDLRFADQAVLRTTSSSR
ncbi:MAG: FtsQ-type POTRA domain-containing protein [bacterium]|nr:FtsQ-type POTRA domain-containing protein [bacterium]